VIFGPLWNVSGRLRNNCAKEFSEVKLSIHVFRKGTEDELDSTELAVAGAIQPNSTRGFEQNVHLRIVAKDWEWHINPS
jgi:hypothetical protein